MTEIEYRDAMEFPMELLAGTLDEMGFKDRLHDHELVTVAAKKLKMFHDMLVATGMNRDLMMAIING